MENVIVKMDVRGFIRFPEEAVKALKLDKLATQTKIADGRTVDVGPYVDVEVDPVGKRIAITPIKTPKSTSFRFINGIIGSKSKFLYFKGAFNAIGLEVATGAYTLVKEGNKFVFTAKGAKKKGEWKTLACRNAVGNKTMLSIDTRGTIIFDHNTKNALNTKENKTMVAEYDAAKKTFKLTFSKNKGFINVRTIASHANASFMGTLSSHGIALPLKSFRTESQVDKNVLTFSIAALVAQQKAAKKK